MVRFDNSYSWARSKKVHYLVEVLEPESKAGNDDEEDEFFMADDETKDDK